MEGVPMGVAPDGTPNLVEQGEVKFNNYVFSNRLFATGGLLAAHNLPTTYADHSFADIAERLSKESSERPNDPISKRGLMSAMTRLQQAQEQVRMEENRSGNKYAHGGKMGRKYDGEGDKPNLLQFYTPQERWLRTLQRQGVVPTYELPAFKKPYSMMTLKKEQQVSILKFLLWLIQELLLRDGWMKILSLFNSIHLPLQVMQEVILTQKTQILTLQDKVGDLHG